MFEWIMYWYRGWDIYLETPKVISFDIFVWYTMCIDY